MQKKAIQRIENAFPHQFYYGAREIYLETLDLPSNFFFNGVLQHWASFFPSTSLRCLPTPRFRSGKRSYLYVNSKLEERHVKDEGFSRVLGIGSPVAHWLKYKNNQINNILERQSILFFPEHYGGQNPINYSEQVIDEMLKQITSVFKNFSITVCVYWNDLLDANWFDLAQRYGVRVVCAGLSLSNPHSLMSQARVDFYKKLLSLIQRHEFVVAENHTSALVYAAAMGKPIQIIRLKIDNRHRNLTSDDNLIHLKYGHLLKEFTQSEKILEAARESIGYYISWDIEDWMKSVHYSLI
jgi:hypothetical protein